MNMIEIELLVAKIRDFVVRAKQQGLPPNLPHPPPAMKAIGPDQVVIGQQEIPIIVDPQTGEISIDTTTVVNPPPVIP